jgi:high-affinity nickel-transport protein
LKNIGGLIGTSVSGVFLLLIGLLNLIILLDIIGVFRRMKRGEYTRLTLEQHLVSGGVLTRLFKHLFSIITQSWQMFPIGFLFGLGFDTASEVALLAISAGAATQGLPFVAVISLPIIFASGMALMDTTDGAFMAKAYSWAFSNPIRKLFYNMTMTGLSVFVALFVGVVELLQILVQVLGLQGEPWDAVAGFDLGSLGYIIVGSFVLAWSVAFGVFKTRRVEERWTALVDS